MLGQEEPWNPVEALKKMPVVGLDFGNLFDIAPGARIAVGKALQMQKPADSKKTPIRVAPMTTVSADISVTPTVSVDTRVAPTASIELLQIRGNAPSDHQGVFTEPTCHIINFHTSGTVWGQGFGKGRASRVGRILIDGGAVVNLMPEGVARRLGLELEDNDDIVIRMATDETRPIHQCTTFDLDVAGVVASIKVYVVDIPQSYSLLLGRRWLYQVRAFGDYSTHAYTIYDAKGLPHEVQPMDRGRTAPLPEILLNPNKRLPYTELTELETEEIMTGQRKMDAIINRIMSEAEDQSKAWEIDDDSDEEGSIEEDSGKECWQ